MLWPVTNGLIGLVLGLSVAGGLAGVATLLCGRLLRLDRWVEDFYLHRYVCRFRRQEYISRGVLPTRSSLSWRVTSEIRALRNRIGYPRQADATFRAQLAEALAAVWPGLAADHASIARFLTAKPRQVRQRIAWASQSLRFSFAGIVAATMQFGVFTAWIRVTSGDSLLSLLSWPQDWSFYWTGAGLNWNGTIDVALTGLLAGFLARPVEEAAARWWRPRPGTAPNASAPESASHTEPATGAGRTPVGRDRRPLRVLNFAGGGFDAVMQLGVAHALTVIQGRAPDAVIGVSAGAANATALAEILQSGEALERQFLRDNNVTDDETRWEELRGRTEGAGLREELERIRVEARVKRLRRYLDAAAAAPGRLVDTVMPDAYQVDSHDPLKPLSQPRFSHEEREEREAAVEQRSGLVRCYNDLLGVYFSVGTVTRFVRRFLGLGAVAEVRKRAARIALVVAEVLKLWVLFGANLRGAANLVIIAFGPVVGLRHRPTFRTAGSIIFRFRHLHDLGRFMKVGYAFLVLVIVWLGVTLLPIALLFTFVSQPALRLAIPLIPVLAVVLVWLWLRKDIAEFERIAVRVAVVDALASLATLAALTVVWTALQLGLLLLVRSVTAEVWLDWPAIVGQLILLTFFGAAIFGLVALIYWLRSPFYETLLNAYQLSASIFHPYAIRSFLVELFDPDYFGQPDMDRVIVESLEDRAHPARRADFPPKPIGYYASEERLEPIHLGIAMADVVTGRIHVADPSTSIVDALVGALSVIPLFPPTRLKGRLWVDAANVTREPTRALFTMLRERLPRDADPSVVHVYSVAPFPASSGQLGRDPEQNDYLSLVDVGFRALRMQRFRDANLQQRLTELISRSMPPGDSRTTIRMGAGGQERDETYFRSWITPIELDRSLSLNRSVLRLPPRERRAAILCAVADGCRASMQVMIHESIEARATRVDGAPDQADRHPAKEAGSVLCADAVRHHIRHRLSQADEADVETARLLSELRLPGRHSRGPGLEEICAQCHLRTGEPRDQALVVEREKWERRGLPWPHEREPESTEPNDPDARFVRRRTEESSAATLERLRVRNWPTGRGGRIRTDPTVSFLFSGGVFRGVYQLGVLTALDNLGLQPNVIAGASVGTITAAMVATAFALPPEVPDERGENRRGRIARLAATYLAMDRLVLTDRFADFIRDFTIRASGTRFSIRQADRVFRKYDFGSAREFNTNMRRVVAGIERLTGVDPYQLNELVRELRADRWDRVVHLSRALLQQWLVQMQVDQEILGTEPLSTLIDKYVVGDLRSEEVPAPTFANLSDRSGIHFMATAANLTHGRLEILGYQDNGTAVLSEGLLASSAFPAVFRPRWRWELYPHDAGSSQDQYVDGGVMDNLPLDAVARFLYDAAREGLIQRTPRAPHLVVAASLEVNTREKAVDLPSESWPTLYQRVGQITYNDKLDQYAAVEARLQKIAKECEATGKTPEVEPVAIDVVDVKPDWLCGTFSFHPMLGFRRINQKRSIAHGCASTLLRFGRLDPDKLREWKVTPGRVPEATTWAAAFAALAKRRAALSRSERKKEDPTCWLRPGIDCPFSAKALALARPKLPKATIRELSDIHKECGKLETQLPRTKV